MAPRPSHIPLLARIPDAAFTLVIACVTSLVSVFVALQSSDTGKYQVLVENQNKTIEALNVQIKNLESKVFELTSKVTQQQIELSNKYDKHSELKNIMDAAPFVTWFNSIELTKEGEIIFPMYHINSKYTYVHGVTLEKYRGLTSDKVWPADIAKIFHDNNIKVLNAKDGMCTFERYPSQTFKPVSASNPIKEHQVCQWLVPFEGGYGILGMAL